MKIGVVIPAYNAAAFLPRCLESVFAQTLKPKEVIVVDDGSTDNTAALAAELGAKVISQTNGGISAARNTGIRNASSEWIALVDVDDVWRDKTGAPGCLHSPRDRARLHRHPDLRRQWRPFRAAGSRRSLGEEDAAVSQLDYPVDRTC